MDQFLADINTTLFGRWLTYQDEGIDMHVNDDETVIDYQARNATGQIRINKVPDVRYRDQEKFLNIIEMAITNEDDENEFYLHFEMTNFKHAVELYNEFITVLKGIHARKKTRVLLCCSGALTTSFFTMNLNEAAESLNLDYEFNATSELAVFTEGVDYDIIMLAPQIAYKRAEVASVLKNKIVVDIPGRLFAKYDVKGTIAFIEEQLKTRTKKIHKTFSVDIKKNIINKDKVLAIGIIQSIRTMVLHYGVYDGNKLVEENEIIKQKFSFHDLKDLIVMMLAQHEGITKIGIASPHVITNADTTIPVLPVDEAVTLQFIRDIQDAYKVRVVFLSDATATAAGFYASQEQYNSVAFVFASYGMTNPSIGSVFDGHMILGKRNMAGAIEFATRQLSAPANELALTPTGEIELVTQTILPIIAINAPEAIAVSSSLIPDMNVLKKSILEHIPVKLVPEIIKLRKIGSYMILGAMIRCIDL